MECMLCTIFECYYWYHIDALIVYSILDLFCIPSSELFLCLIIWVTPPVAFAPSRGIASLALVTFATL